MRDPSWRYALVAAAISCACGACSSEYHPEYHPVSSYTVNQSVAYPTIYQVAGAPSSPVEPPAAPDPATTLERVDPSQVLVVESAHLDRPNEVIGVIDVQDARGTHDSGLALLRERAAELGADAVVSVEFHRGDGAGHVAHVSGLGVRYQRGARERNGE
jgi:hypothetical protein